MRCAIWIAAFSCFLAATVAAQQIPAGTALPIMAGRSLDSAKSKPGDKVTGKLMQDVVLPSGEKLPRGARVEGQVVEPSTPAASSTAHLAVRFDRIMVDGKAVPINVSLRALASMQSVFEAQLPTSSFDEYGTSISDWTTVQVGGAAVYLGDETVRDAMDIVGRAPGYGTVMAKLVPAPKVGCPATTMSASDREQSLWVFSPWACGAYGFADLAISHHGATAPLGTIVLTASKGIHVRGGSGWLLVVLSSDPDKSAALGK